MKNNKKLIVVIEYPNGHVSETPFTTEKGARIYAKNKGDGGELLNGSNCKYEIPVRVYRK